MTTLYISPNSPFESIGGVERYLSNLINHYRHKPGEVVLLVPSYTESRVEMHGKVTVYLDTSLVIPSNADAHRRVVTSNAEAFAKVVVDVIDKHDIGVICAENFHLGLPPAYSLQLNMVAATRKIPTVLKLHSFAKSTIQTELINQLMWNRVSCVSKSVAGDCFRKGADIDTLMTDYLGVDTKLFNDKVEKDWLKSELGFSQKSKVLLTATRIILGEKEILKDKGIINLIRTFSKLSGRYPDLRLVIAVGRAPSNLQSSFNQALEMLKGYLKLHGVADKTAVQMFELDEMPKVYSGADIFILASENETFGQVFVEAMASGTPVIGTNVGGIPEIISDARNGYLVPPHNPTVLSHRIESILNDDETRSEFIQSGLENVKLRFDSDLQLESFDEQLAHLVASS